MTTHIFNASNKCVSQGKNLAVINAHARKRGIERIRVDPVRSANYEAVVNVFYKDGYRAITDFASLSVATKWAQGKSKRTGCTLEVYG